LHQKDLLLITPPFVQINTAYPATANLKGFLQKHNYKVAQLDLSIACISKLFSSEMLTLLIEKARSAKSEYSENALNILQHADEYITYIDAVILFLQSKDMSFAYTINNNILPKTARFNIQQDLDWHFGANGNIDKARFLATVFLEDIADFITECIDNRFGFSRYAEQICLNVIEYDNILFELKKDTIITHLMTELLEESIKQHQPKVIGFSIPFPGNLLMALKSAEYIKKHHPEIKVVLGGGFVNTEFRNLSEIRLFKLVDYVCLDDGELPLLKLLNHLTKGETPLKRTFISQNNKVVFVDNALENDFKHNDTGTPDFGDLPLNEYISVTETTNPMHNLWSNGRWNKMALAHGCYWHKCSFCDTSLDYIKRYDTADTGILCNRIEAIISQTQYHGFHFVDEAASPALLRKLATEIIKRKLCISWWTNIRFEAAFSEDLCKLMAKSGCIAVSGGIEVASDRLLKLMNKGVDIEQLTLAAYNFRKSGIMIHAYLMYGFPTQTTQETIDSLEIVRQLFAEGLINSAFWHRFAMTVHSPVGMYPEKFNVIKESLSENAFTQNGCHHTDSIASNHEKFESGLKTSLYNYIHDNGFEFHLQDWFDFKVPQTSIPTNYIRRILKSKSKKSSNKHYK